MTSGEPSGFEHHVRKNGEVEIRHHGRPVTVLRGNVARTFVAALSRADGAAAQHLMARATGHYRHGNERVAGTHARRGG